MTTKMAPNATSEEIRQYADSFYADLQRGTPFSTILGAIKDPYTKVLTKRIKADIDRFGIDKSGSVYGANSNIDQVRQDAWDTFAPGEAAPFDTSLAASTAASTPSVQQKKDKGILGLGKVGDMVALAAGAYFGAPYLASALPVKSLTGGMLDTTGTLPDSSFDFDLGGGKNGPQES